MSNNNNPLDDEKVVDINVDKIKNRTSKLIPVVVFLALVVLLAANSFFYVDASDDAVVLRLGKYSYTEEAAGFHFKIPFIDQVEAVNVEKAYSMDYGYRTGQSGTTSSSPEYGDATEEATVIIDGSNNNASIALIELNINYKVDNPREFLFRVDDVEGTLRLALEDVVRTTLQSFTVEEVRTQKEGIDNVIMPALQKKLEQYNTGLVITKVKTQNVNFLPSVETALKEKENANQYKNGKVEDGEKYENTIMPEAEAEAITIVQEANAYSATVKADAKAEVAQFLALYEEYQNNEEILRQRYYLDAMREFLSNNKIVVDMTEGNNLLKLFNEDGQQFN